MARQKGLEPLAYCLEGSCSIQLSYWRTWGTAFGPHRGPTCFLDRDLFLAATQTFSPPLAPIRNANRAQRHTAVEQVMGIEPTRPAWKAGVLPLNYTCAFCGEDYYTTAPPWRQGFSRAFSQKVKAPPPCSQGKALSLLVSLPYIVSKTSSPSFAVTATPAMAPSPRSTRMLAMRSSTIRRMLLRKSLAPLLPWMDFSASRAQAAWS